VEDHCRAIQLVMEQGQPGAIYNIERATSAQTWKSFELYSALAQAQSLIQFVNDRPGHDRRYAIDPRLIEQELNWTPQETWQSGLEKTITWYRDNPAWIEATRTGAYRDYYRKQYGSEWKRRESLGNRCSWNGRPRCFTVLFGAGRQRFCFRP
jgi:dTDP-glucose 4,6-dehydratase